MLKKISALTITILILTAGFLAFNVNSSLALTSDPSKLDIVIGPTSVLADNNTYNSVFIQLKDVNNKPARALQDTVITLSSSSTNIGTVDTSAIVQKGKTYTSANFFSTNTSGSATITAAATGFATVQSSISTITESGSMPSKFAVFCVPQTLPSDASTYPAIQVQLQDAQNRPTKAAEADVTVNIFSSTPEVGDVTTSTLIVPVGKSQATGSIKVTNAPGITIITAAWSNYTTGTATITTQLIDYSPLQVTVTSKPGTISNGNNAQVTAYITADGAPVTGATVVFTSNNGGTFSAQQQGNGYYNTTFTAPNFSQTTVSTIIASASKTGYLDSQGTTQISVTPNEAPTPNPTNTTGVNQGTIQLCIVDVNNTPLNNTLVSSIAQPAGMTTLNEITNATGYVTFQNAISGSYTFKIIRGSTSMNQTFDYTGQPLALTLTLLDSNAPATADNTVLLIAAIVIVIIAVSAVSALVIVKRKKTERIRKLHELQNQLKRKY